MDLSSSSEADGPAPVVGMNNKMMSIQLFKRGVRVVYNGQSCTVHHVMLSKGRVMVKLNELQEAVDSIKLELQPTRMSLLRH
jgi:hypothetical protein